MPAPDLTDEAAARLSPSAVVGITRQAGGGNNRLYRVETIEGRFYALKWYTRPIGDQRDRLGTEWAALTFLHEHGVTKVPCPIKADSAGGFALYEWIDGRQPGGIGPAEIDAALSFAGELNALADASAAASLPMASEACLSLGDVLDQVARRYLRLAQVAPGEPELAEFLNDEFAPCRSRVEEVARRSLDTAGWAWDRPLAQSSRCLSPSDFGFHNALRRNDGSLVFLDFEYFGWDDPVKLVADFMQHPGMTLSRPLARRFADGAQALFGGEAFGQRLEIFYPLFALRWCLILLNEFLPERWQNRQFAGHPNDRRQAMRNQLDKARSHLRQHATDQL